MQSLLAQSMTHTSPFRYFTHLAFRQLLKELFRLLVVLPAKGSGGLIEFLYRHPVARIEAYALSLPCRRRPALGPNPAPAGTIT